MLIDILANVVVSQ